MRRDDFSELQVLIVGGKPHAVATLRTVFGIVGLNRVIAVTGAARAIEVLRDQAMDAVFCDEHADTVDDVPFPLAARRAEGVLNPMLPIFLVCSSPLRRQVESARDDGITDVIVRPISAATVSRKLRGAMLAPRPFILASGFFGPDRRGGGRAPYGGRDRRSRTPKKLKVSLNESAALLSQASQKDAEELQVEL